MACRLAHRERGASVRIGGPSGTMTPILGSPNTFLLSIGGGGICRTQNAAQSWSQQNSGISAFNGIALAWDPEAPSTVYLGAVNGGGIFKSADAGLTWVDQLQDSISALAVDPFDSTHLLAASQSQGLIEGHDAGNTWKNISSLLPNAVNTTVITGLAFHPTQSGMIFVATAIGGIGLLRSTDGGATWATANTCLSVTDVGGCFAFNPADPKSLINADSAGTAVSSDNGNTWVESTSAISCTFSVDGKAKPPIVYASQGAYSTAVAAKSGDFGKSWTTLSHVPGLIVDPGTANSVFGIA